MSKPEDITFNSIHPIQRSVVFLTNDKAVLTITAAGELVFDSATEAAIALKREWDRIMSRPVADSAPEALNSGNG